MANSIDAILYSYKSKNLKLVVETLLKNTHSPITVHVLDQNPLDRSSAFEDSRVVYEHIYWDAIKSPSERKASIIDSSSSDYILQLSDDCLLEPGWDNKIIEVVGKKDVVVSGIGVAKLVKLDHFSVQASWEKSLDFHITNYIDRNFVFATNEVWNSISYPYYLKYRGEEEMLSLDFFRSGKDIFSSTAGTYKDLKQRVLEKTYLPFSKEHNYNRVVEALTSNGTDRDNGFSRTRDSFLEFHDLLGLDIVNLPYQTNDVDYNPDNLAFQDIDARKFISNVKTIY
jgi:hypothetical protein